MAAPALALRVCTLAPDDQSSGHARPAAIAQLGERQTEDLKVPGSIPGLGMLHTGQWEVNAGLRAALLRAPGQLLFVRPLVLRCHDATRRGMPHVLRHAHAATHGQTRLAFWGGGAVSRNTWTPMCQCRTLLQKISFMAAIAQLGERQT